MLSNNVTGFTPSTFNLIDIPGLEDFHIWFAPLLFCVYFVTLLGNFMLLLPLKTMLHKPMYIFIFQLAFCDLALSSCIVPKMLDIFWCNNGQIQFSACLIQMFFVQFFSVLESSILSTMAFDRYVAVCNPLRYHSILTNSLIVKMTATSLCRSVFLILPLPIEAMWFSFCGNNVSHSICTYAALAKLSCTLLNDDNMYPLAVLLLIAPVDMLWIALSYVLILRAVLRLPHKDDRVKAFSTCGSHVRVISALYIPFLFVTLLNRIHHNIPRYMHVIAANTYLIFPPLANPLIYGVTIKEVRRMMQKIC